MITLSIGTRLDRFAFHFGRYLIVALSREEVTLQLAPFGRFYWAKGVGSCTEDWKTAKKTAWSGLDPLGMY